MMEGDERLRIASVDLLPGETAVVLQLEGLLSPVKVDSMAVA